MVSMGQQITGEVEWSDRPGGAAGLRADGEPKADSQVQDIITRTVEQDVIPRLLEALGQAAKPAATRPAGPPGGAVAPSAVDDLVQLILAHEEARSIELVEALHAGGITAERLYLDLLAPAARQLGQLWTDDECDFTEVTIGLFLLQNTLRELGAAFRGDACADESAPHALLAPLPGEQHTFGLSMLFDFFRRAGWNAWCGPIQSDRELRDMVSANWYDMIGFSVACDERLADTLAVIRMVRKVSRNPGVSVMVGGPGFAANPALAALVEADGTAVDGLQAVEQANALVRLARSRRCS